MTRVSARDGPVAAELADAAAAHASLPDRARAVLDSLRRTLGYEAGVISLYDPDRGGYSTLITDGYGERIARRMNTAAFDAEMEAVGLPGARSTMRVRDLPVPPESVSILADYLFPAGFREGLGVPLVTPDDRHVGVLNLTTANPEPASPQVCALVRNLSPLIAHAVDPMRTVTALAAMVTDAVAGVVVTRAGRVTELAALPGHAALRPRAPALLAALIRVTTHQQYVTFLCPVDTGLARVTALAVPAEQPGHAGAVVLLSPPPNLRGLTRRELEVLGALAEGWSSPRIAAGLAVTERTVTAHLEHIRFKLRAGSRTLAAVRAVRQGLYIPVELTIALPRKVASRKVVYSRPPAG